MSKQQYEIFKVILASLVLALTACSQESDQVINGDMPQTSATQASNLNSKGRVLSFSNDSRISYCEVLANQPSSYSGFRDQALYPLASLSKVITTVWAIDQLGSDYRFASEWHLRPVSGQPGTYDAYLRTNYDPVINLEKILYYLSELNRRGVRSIRELTIDETTRVFLSTLKQPHIELKQVPISTTESGQNLFNMMNSENWGDSVQKAKMSLLSWASQNRKSLQIPSQFEVESVVYRPAEQIQKKQYSLVFTVTSAPLFQYLKNVNVFSNNYISDLLFWRLGGVNRFQQFQSQKLKLTAKDLVFYTGSGLADQKTGVRKDNLGSCYSMLKVLNFMSEQAKRQNLNLGYLLLNASRDGQGTFQSQVPMSLRVDNLVLKTGRLFDNPALNLTGVVATRKGPLYFTFLGHNFKPNEAIYIEKARDQMLTDLLRYYPTEKTFTSTVQQEIFL